MGDLSFLANSGMRRAVFLMGTFDVINSQACVGGTNGWDGKAGSAGDPLVYYGAEIQKAEELFPGVSLVAGTIPAARSAIRERGMCRCAEWSEYEDQSRWPRRTRYRWFATFMRRLRGVGRITTSGAYAGIAPNAEGYAAMARAYDEVNQ